MYTEGRYRITIDRLNCLGVRANDHGQGFRPLCETAASIEHFSELAEKLCTSHTEKNAALLYARALVHSSSCESFCDFPKKEPVSTATVSTGGNSSSKCSRTGNAPDKVLSSTAILLRSVFEVSRVRTERSKVFLCIILSSDRGVHKGVLVKEAL